MNHIFIRNVNNLRFVLLVGLLSLFGSATAQDDATLIGHWTLDNHANDASGNANHGRLISLGKDSEVLLGG